ncbi:unnamed protein product [Durusdinium trenchii]|uniref:Uncharacterized protein n=1 Tax=Durusdinium trenchii TaxID=1381693 RepID=A0ABP0KMH1_9DINO
MEEEVLSLHSSTGNYSWVQELYLPLPSNPEWESDMSIKYIDQQGIQRVTGGWELKLSQRYPSLLGDAVAQLYHQHRPEVKRLVLARRPWAMGLMRNGVWKSRLIEYQDF